MPPDIEKLSAKELFELANKKLQQEQEAAQRLARLTESRQRQQELIAAHEQAIAAIDRDLIALKQRRDQLVAAHQANLAAIEQELKQLAQQAATGEQDSAAPKAPARELPAPATPATASPGPAASAFSGKASTEDDLASAILETLKGRNDISDSLLREKLRLKGFALANLPKQLDRLVREGLISNKGGGNFALKRKL